MGAPGIGSSYKALRDRAYFVYPSHMDIMNIYLLYMGAPGTGLPYISRSHGRCEYIPVRLMVASLLPTPCDRDI